MTDTEKFNIDIADGICVLTINNEKRRNALNRAMWAAVPELITDIQARDDVNVILLRGAGDVAFCAGADISEFDAERTGDAANEYDRLNNEAFAALMGCTKPLIAVVNGFAFGGGFQIAACCDMRLASESAQFAIPAARLGIGYNPRWLRTLLGILSPADLKEILFTGERYDAEKMQRIGFINRVSPPMELMADARKLATRIAANAPLSIHAAKLSIDALAKAPENADFEALDAAVRACFESGDYAEGRQAFMEKRPPKYTGS